MNRNDGVPSIPNEKPGCLSAVFALFRGRPAAKERSAERFPYGVRDDFLSEAESSFYRVLNNMMGDRFLVFPKVRLGDIFFVSRPHENAAARNKIDRKHVDFLICDAQTLDPALGIELDDSSHQKRERVERDAFVDDVFEVAGLPLVRVATKQTYDTRELGVLFRNALHRSADPATPGPPPTQAASQEGADPAPSASPPLCPKCGIPMVVRTAARGPRAGEKFYGCANFPRCKTILPLDGGTYPN